MSGVLVAGDYLLYSKSLLSAIAGTDLSAVSYSTNPPAINMSQQTY